MRVTKLTALGKIEVMEGGIPQLQTDTDVQVQVKAVGICGTDLHMFREARSDVTLPRVMGHELAGLVTQVGKGVTGLKVGDHVVLDPVFACGNCPTCQKGYFNVCSHVCCYGVQMDGGFQDYIVVDQKHLYPYDETIPYEEAALAEPFSIAANIVDRAQMTAQDQVLVIGAGTIGLSILQVAKSIGAKVMVSDVVGTKLEKAVAMGADYVVNSKTESLQEKVKEAYIDGADVVIDAVGVTPLFQTAVDCAAPRGRVICIGFDGRPAEIPPVRITKAELSIIGSRMNCGKFPKVMQWLNGGKIDARKMISRVYSVEQIQQAFEETLADSAGSVKTIITF